MASATEFSEQRGAGQPGAAGGIEVRNWGRDLVSHPQVVVEARSVDDIVAVMRDRERYPAPVRAHGSAHSTTLCGGADGGTVVNMRKLDRIASIGSDTVTAEAGALLIDVAKALERRNLQFYVNIELGNATMGSIACCATKDASMPGEFGQVNSYCVGLKMVTAAGEILEVSENDPELLELARSSYGLFGIVYEATFKVRPLQAMAVEHHTYSVEEFGRKLPELIARGESMMLYIFPFLDRLTVEFRRYSGAEAEARETSMPNHLIWRLRNLAWKSVAPGFGYLAERYVPFKGPRYRLVNGFNRLVQLTMRQVLAGPHTLPSDQTIKYPHESGWTRYTFSIWAFPEEHYAETLRAYFRWARDYYRERGWRPNMTHVGYRILKDTSSLFSYSADTNVLTIDPVSTGAPGWREFLSAYNDFCSTHGGKPLFNQTWGLTPAQVRRAFGDRIDRFEDARRRHDPEDRLLNEYFRDLLQAPAR
jgi:FAD/FMN-containing dehydrogenase